MKDLVLTGLGNEMDIKTGKLVFTAVFNGDLRIEISREAAETLTRAVYSGDAEASDYEKPPLSPNKSSFDQEESAEESILEEGSSRGLYDDDTGVEQV